MYVGMHYLLQGHIPHKNNYCVTLYYSPTHPPPLWFTTGSWALYMELLWWSLTTLWHHYYIIWDVAKWNWWNNFLYQLVVGWCYMFSHADKTYLELWLKTYVTVFGKKGVNMHPVFQTWGYTTLLVESQQLWNLVVRFSYHCTTECKW